MAETNKANLATADDNLSFGKLLPDKIVKKKFEEDTKALQRDRELKENLEKKKNDAISQHKKEFDKNFEEIEAFKTDLEEKLKYVAS